ncbi:hypothetical protein ADEAN_000178500 [Angomonas deanei]|uniref:Uncharacterized protein n=1 Tax=Angomonas deanei TaxID=59799 RepID=A0A7G2C3R8_9TRYP|nr:hypothetical protein ADEAN_000178500 [Angomonas deanei]
MRERDFNTNNTNNINYLLFSQFSIADEIIRKYFSSLTTEFLSPITVWYRSVMYNYCSTFDTSYLDVLNSAAGGGERNEDDGENASADRSREKQAIVNYEVPRKTENREENLYRTVFQLCDKNFLEKCLLSPAIFLAFFDKHHRQVAPSLWTANHNYKSYKLIYESFCNGILFVNFLYQLIDESLNEAFQHFEVDVFLTYYPTEQSRIDFFITIYKYLQALVEKCIDPDVLQVRAVTSVLAAVASSIEPPLREHFMNMIEGLRL